MTDLAAKQAIEEIAARYADGCDQQDWSAVLDLFEPDAVFDASSVYGQTMTGREELRKFFESAPVAAGHHPTSLYSTIDGDTASTRMKMMVLFRSGLFSVDYAWNLKRRADQWRIARQQITVVGKVPLGSQAA